MRVKSRPHIWDAFMPKNILRNIRSNIQSEDGISSALVSPRGWSRCTNGAERPRLDVVDPLLDPHRLFSPPLSACSSYSGQGWRGWGGGSSLRPGGVGVHVWFFLKRYPSRWSALLGARTTAYIHLDTHLNHQLTKLHVLCVSLHEAQQY